MCFYKITACFLLFILQNQIKLIKINPLKTKVKPHLSLYFSIITLIRWRGSYTIAQHWPVTKMEFSNSAPF